MGGEKDDALLAVLFIGPQTFPFALSRGNENIVYIKSQKFLGDFELFFPPFFYYYFLVLKTRFFIQIAGKKRVKKASGDFVCRNVLLLVCFCVYESGIVAITWH